MAIRTSITDWKIWQAIVTCTIYLLAGHKKPVTCVASQMKISLSSKIYTLHNNYFKTYKTLEKIEKQKD